VFTKNGPVWPAGVTGGYDPIKHAGGLHLGPFGNGLAVDGAITSTNSAGEANMFYILQQFIFKTYYNNNV
jgi:pantoate kinase